jgi:hypothetical protein
MARSPNALGSNVLDFRGFSSIVYTFLFNAYHHRYHEFFEDMVENPTFKLHFCQRLFNSGVVDSSLHELYYNTFMTLVGFDAHDREKSYNQMAHTIKILNSVYGFNKTQQMHYHINLQRILDHYKINDRSFLSTPEPFEASFEQDVAAFAVAATNPYQLPSFEEFIEEMERVYEITPDLSQSTQHTQNPEDLPVMVDDSVQPYTIDMDIFGFNKAEDKEVSNIFYRKSKQEDDLFDI